MKIFEYLKVTDCNLNQEQLADLGLGGWELITVIQDPTFKCRSFIFYFKREKQ